MESDHLEEAERFLRSALHQDADVGQVSRYDLEAPCTMSRKRASKD
jgi:hypothetical protein